MLKANIITFEEAKKFGLTDDGEDLYGESVCGAMCSVKIQKKQGAKEIFLEKYTIKINGGKDLLFLHKDFIKEKQDRGEFEDYLNQFDKIKGVEAKKYIKDFNLIITNQEIS